MTGAEMTHVPYKGTTQFQADLYEGRVQVSIDNVLAHLPHIAPGKVRCLAVTSRTRSPLLPDRPTIADRRPRRVDDHRLLRPCSCRCAWASR